MHVSIEGETTAHAVEAKIILTCKYTYFVRVEGLGKDLFQEKLRARRIILPFDRYGRWKSFNDHDHDDVLRYFYCLSLLPFRYFATMVT